MSRIRSKYEIERDALVSAQARYIALEARLRREANVLAGQGLDLDRILPKSTSIAGLSSTAIRVKAERLERDLEAAQAEAAVHLDHRCQTAFDEAFAAAKARLSAERIGPRLGEQRLEPGDSATPARSAPDFSAQIKSAQEDLTRVLARVHERAPATARTRVASLAALLGQATNQGEVERVVLAVRSAVQDANDQARELLVRQRQIDRWTERLHLIEGDAAVEQRERLQRLNRTLPWSHELHTAIEAEIVEAENDYDRARALDATKQALASMGYQIADDFTQETFASSGSLAGIPDRAEHQLRIRERSGEILMDVVRVAGPLDLEEDREAEQTVCDSLPLLTDNARALGVTLQAQAWPASGEVEHIGLESSGPGHENRSGRSRTGPSAGRDRER